ncbi:MAG: hypothetical protein EA363_04975 [Balneolaceae bacterium]|nr:MAG: hypothetical protein EA363_04975 [Balneolaceae bacterium]
MSSNGDTLEADTDCEDQFIETAWDRDHRDMDTDFRKRDRDHAERDGDVAEWDWDHAGQDDPGISAEGDSGIGISAEADAAKDKANGSDGTSRSGWMGVLPPIAGIAIALIVIIAYRFGRAAKKA